MIINVYEIFEEFSSVSTKQERIQILQKYNLQYFKDVLKYAFNPQYQFYITEFPKDYIKPDTFPGLRIAGFESEIRKVYLFLKGNPVADTLTESKRNILLLQLLESFEPKEAVIFVNMMKKDLQVKGLSESLVKEVYPELFL